MVCGAVHLASSHPLPSLFFFLPLFYQCDGCLEYGGSWLGWGNLAWQPWRQFSIWPQWKPLGIPGTHLPLKRGSWLKIYFRKKSKIFGINSITEMHLIILKNMWLAAFFCELRRRRFSLILRLNFLR